VKSRIGKFGVVTVRLDLIKVQRTRSKSQVGPTSSGFSTRKRRDEFSRRFNAGIRRADCSSVATIEFSLIELVADATEHFAPFPAALKDRAKFMQTLRVEDK